MTEGIFTNLFQPVYMICSCTFAGNGWKHLITASRIDIYEKRDNVCYSHHTISPRVSLHRQHYGYVTYPLFNRRMINRSSYFLYNKPQFFSNSCGRHHQKLSIYIHSSGIMADSHLTCKITLKSMSVYAIHG